MPEVTQFQALTVDPEEVTPQWTPPKLNGEDPSTKSTWPLQAPSDSSSETTSNMSQTTAKQALPKLPIPTRLSFTYPADSHLQTLTFATPKSTSLERKVCLEDFKFLAVFGRMEVETRFTSNHYLPTFWNQLISMNLWFTGILIHRRCWLLFRLQTCSACKFWRLQW